MLRGSPFLAAALDVIAQVESDGSLVGAPSTTKRSPEDWPNRSVSWTIEVGDLGGQITAWEDGSSELDLVDMAGGDAYSEHRQLDDLDDIQLAVEAVRNWVVERRSPGVDS
jgi:hypothetical protein